MHFTCSPACCRNNFSSKQIAAYMMVSVKHDGFPVKWTIYRTIIIYACSKYLYMSICLCYGCCNLWSAGCRSRCIRELLKYTCNVIGNRGGNHDPAIYIYVNDGKYLIISSRSVWITINNLIGVYMMSNICGHSCGSIEINDPSGNAFKRPPVIYWREKNSVGKM